MYLRCCGENRLGGERVGAGGAGGQWCAQTRVGAEGEGKEEDSRSHSNEQVAGVCVGKYLCRLHARGFPCLGRPWWCPYLGSTLRMRNAGLVSDRRSRFTGHSFSWEAKLEGQGMQA